MKSRFCLFLFWLFLLTMVGGSREKSLLLSDSKEVLEQSMTAASRVSETEDAVEENWKELLVEKEPASTMVGQESFSGEAEAIDLSEPEENQEPEVIVLPAGKPDGTVMAADKSAAKQMYCEGKEAKLLEIGATFEKKVVSQDEYYYLLRVNPVTGELNLKPVSRVLKTEAPVFQLDTTDHPEYVQSRYCIAVRNGVGYARISQVLSVSRPELLAENTEEYALAKTKKGIQELNLKEVLETGSKQVFLNITASEILPLESNPVTYEYDGEKYLFNSMEKLQKEVRQFNEHGIVVTAQLLLNRVEESLILPEARKGTCAFYTWNTREERPRKKMEAMFSYLGELFGKEDCYITNWILGNEINSCNAWNYAGEISGKTYITIYCEAFQVLYQAVRSRKSSTKVFLCLDHNWNTAPAGYSSKAALDAFAKVMRRIQPDLQWNLAYHAYPSPLTDVAFWKNKVSNDLSSSIIHMGNLQVLTDYVRDTYGSQTRILLSEQGFTSAQGEPLQAAALCYAYYIAACNPMIDGFHIRSLRDNEIETSQGLMMGIQGKEAYEVYCHMDEVETLSYTTPYISLTGKLSWNEIPNYAPERLHTNYREE